MSKKYYVRDEKINDKVAKIDQIYRSKVNKSVELAVFCGVNVAYKIIWENYVVPYMAAKNDEERASRLGALIEHIEMHYRNAKKVDEEVQGKKVEK